MTAALQKQSCGGAPNRRMPGIQKAAILLISLGSDGAADVLRHLGEDEIEALSLEMAKLQWVDPMATDFVREELVAVVQAYESLAIGGVDYARDVLELALGSERAAELMGRLTSVIEKRPFEFLRRTPPEQIITVLRREAPQTIAVVIAHLHTTLAAQVLSSLTDTAQADAALRIAQLGPITPDVVREIENHIRHSLASVAHRDTTTTTGVEALAHILTHSARSTERNVLDTLSETDAELADEIRQLLFTFEDIAALDDRAIQSILREADPKDIALAVRGVSEEIKDRILSNMSARAAQMLIEDLQAQPPQRRRVIEDAQGRLVAILRRLEDAGSIILARGDQEPVI